MQKTLLVATTKLRIKRVSTKFLCHHARRESPSNASHTLLGCSSNDVVEQHQLERPVEHILHAIPPREAPLRDEVPFYASIEPPSSQHRLSRKSAAHLIEPKSALGVPQTGHLQRKSPKNALGVRQTGHLQHPGGKKSGHIRQREGIAEAEGSLWSCGPVPPSAP